MSHADILKVLAEATEVCGVESVSLRCETDLSEAVYVELGAEGIVVSDQGETFAYLGFESDDTTFGAWDMAVAKKCCAAYGVELVDDSDEHSAAFRIQGFADDSRPLAGVIHAVASAIDAVFGALEVAPR
jgi:hypothetical protein